MLVSERMTRDPVTIGPDDSLTLAVQKLRAGNFRRLPVVQGGQLIGILSEYDIERHHESIFWDTVQSLMTPDPIVVEPSTTIDRAASLLMRHRIGALPVVNCGRLVGIISAHDMMLPEPRPLTKWIPPLKQSGE
jgi:acetoin utilization protein AcuB